MANSQITMATYNGHLYALIGQNEVVCQIANANAQKIESGQNDWHPATVASPAENAMLTGLLDSAGTAAKAWIGLYQQPGSA